MQESKGAFFWITTLVLFMGGLFLVSAGSFVSALRHPSTVVDPEYYSHGVAYGRGTGDAGWDLKAALTPGQLEVTVADAAGAPVTGGRLTCRLAGASGSGAALHFLEGRPGVYFTPRKMLPRGDLRTTLLFSRGSAQSTRKMVILQ